MNTPRQKLAELIARYGKGLSDDPKRCEGLLRDVCGQYKREIFVLVSAVREGIPSGLQHSWDGIPKDVMLARLTNRLHEDLGVAENLARWAVESWALALGVASTKDFRFPFKCPGCGASGTIATRLAGQKINCPKCKATLAVSDDGRGISIERTAGAPVRSLAETISVQASTVTIGMLTSPEEDDLFSEFPRVSAEDLLRQTIRRVLADGVVTDEERTEVQNIRKALGIPSDVASRILVQVKSELGSILQDPSRPEQQAQRDYFIGPPGNELIGPPKDELGVTLPKQQVPTPDSNSVAYRLGYLIGDGILRLLPTLISILPTLISIAIIGWTTVRYAQTDGIGVGLLAWVTASLLFGTAVGRTAKTFSARLFLTFGVPACGLLGSFIVPGSFWAGWWIVWLGGFVMFCVAAVDA